MKEKPGVDRKQKIVLSAAKVFSEKGAAFVRLNEVAKAAKVPAPLIHYYYKTIEDLHLDVIQYALQSLLEFSTKGLTEKPTTTEALHEYIRTPFLWIDKHPDLASILVYFYYMATFSERFRAMNSVIRERGRERITMMIYRGLERKEFTLPKGEAVKDVAYDVQSIITGHFFQFTTEARTRKLQEYMERAVGDVFHLLGVEV